MNRENLWVQAALIVVIILAVGQGAFILYSSVISPSSLQAQLDTANQQKQASDRRASELNAAMTVYQHMVGTSTDQAALAAAEDELRTRPVDQQVASSVVSTLDRFRRDMIEKFPEGYTEAKNYATLPVYFLSTIRERNKELSDIKTQLAQMTRDVAAIRAEGQQLVTAANATRDDAIAKRDEYERLHREKDEQLKREKATMESQLGEALAKVDGLIKEFQGKEQNLTKEITNLRSNLLSLRERIRKEEDRTFEGADGQVIAASGGRVYINVGSAHNVRRQTLFAVYEKGETRFRDAKPKASIEVVNVINESMSEAKVTSGQGMILSGDVIQSPVWNPGEKVHFAIAGFIDLSNNGKSDQPLLESILRQNGGEIDSYVQPDGKIQGNITAQTRYLVLGQRPDDRSSPEFLTGYTNQLQRAENMGVETITVAKLLDMMGYQGSAQVMARMSNP